MNDYDDRTAKEEFEEYVIFFSQFGECPKTVEIAERLDKNGYHVLDIEDESIEESEYPHMVYADIELINNISDKPLAKAKRILCHIDALLHPDDSSKPFLPPADDPSDDDNGDEFNVADFIAEFNHEFSDSH